MSQVLLSIQELYVGRKLYCLFNIFWRIMYLHISNYYTMYCMCDTTNLIIFLLAS